MEQVDFMMLSERGQNEVLGAVRSQITLESLNENTDFCKLSYEEQLHEAERAVENGEFIIMKDRTTYRVYRMIKRFVK